MLPNETPPDDGEYRCPIQPNHSHFIMAPSDDWGGETTTMFTIMRVLKERLPAVAVVANGGYISKMEVRCLRWFKSMKLVH